MQGTLTISHIHGDTEYVSIKITDEASRVRFVEARISHEEFGKALGSRASRPCGLEVRGLELVGKTPEIKTEPLPKHTDAARAVAIALSKDDAAPYEVDGWQADVEAAYSAQQNGNNLVVVFRRYVDLKAAEAEGGE